MIFIRFWDGNQWKVEVRRFLDGIHHSTTRLNIERIPSVMFELKSGVCFLDHISVRELAATTEKAVDRIPWNSHNKSSPPPKQGVPRLPAKDYEERKSWFTENFEPSWIEEVWDTFSHDSQKFQIRCRFS